MKHSHKLEVTNVKLECVRGKGELERERDALHSQVDGTDLSQSLFPHFISLSLSLFLLFWFVCLSLMHPFFSICSYIIFSCSYSPSLFWSVSFSPSSHLSPLSTPLTLRSPPALQSDVEVLRMTVERNKEMLTEKEREMVRRVQAAREEELHKMAAVQEEK